MMLWSSAGFASEKSGRDGTLRDEAFAKIVTKFDVLEAASVDVEKWKTFTNEHGGLAWDTSYALDAYLDMYQATRDWKYVQKFMILADALAERTDERRGLADYKGRRRVGWGAVKYSKAGERVVWLAHTGMIAYPLARFSLLVGERAASVGIVSKAARLRRLAEAALQEFDGQWRYDPVTGFGHYVYEDAEPIGYPGVTDMSVPFNQQLAAGRAFIILWKLTGNLAYLQKAEGLARHFKSHLRMDLAGGYEWDYRYGSGLARYGSREDISHGAIDVDFAVLAAQESLVFSRDDLAGFVLAFTRETRTSGGNMLDASDAAGRWLELTGTDCQVYRAVFPYLMGKVGTQHSQVLLGVAKLAKYVKRCLGGR